jgi:hypothetical protein
VQAQLEDERGRYSQLTSEHDKHNKDLRELQGELKKSKMKSIKDQDMYNKILQVSEVYMIYGTTTVCICLYVLLEIEIVIYC